MKGLPKRTTRGKRMNELIGEEKDTDNLFWSQTYFKETVSDDEYCTESEKADKFDADFFKSETEDEDQEEVEISKKRKRNEVKVKVTAKKKNTRIQSMKGFSQKQMLEEAAITEMFNSYSLGQLMSLEQSKKQDTFNRKSQIQVTWRSSDAIVDGNRVVKLWTSEDMSFQTYEPGEVPVCSVSKLPARYRDPRTGEYYHDLKSFKILREKYHSAQEHPFKERLKELKLKLAKG